MRRLVGLLLALSCTAGVSSAADLALDYPTRCGPLQCYPRVTNPNEFYYLPTQPRVSQEEGAKPEFSFLRYVEGSTTGGTGGIKQANGGGVVHFLVDYGVTDAERAAAQAALQEDNEEAQLLGPVAFEAGSFFLTSAITGDGTERREGLTHAVLGTGRAPLMEGQKSAISMHLTRRGSQILWSTFETVAPDVSVTLNLEFTGLRDPAEVTIIANWDKIEEMADIEVGVEVAYYVVELGFDYEEFWQKVQDSGAITIDAKGDIGDMQDIVDRTIKSLHEYLFAPVALEQYEDDDVEQAMDQFSSMAQQAQSDMSILTLSGGYKRREVRRSGNMVFNFRNQLSDTVTISLAGNVGDIGARYRNDPTVFRTVNISDDPAFRRREVSVMVDALNAADFTNYINNVSMTLRKEHGSGQVSLGEASFNRMRFDIAETKTLSYPWDGEAGEEDWLQYEYVVTWSFRGGATYEAEKRTTRSGAVALTPPYEYRRIQFMANPDELSRQGVRKVTVAVRHDFYGRPMRKTVELIPELNRYSEILDFAVPENSEGIRYQITWRLHDRREIKGPWLESTESTIICDEMPAA